MYVTVFIIPPFGCRTLSFERLECLLVAQLYDHCISIVVTSTSPANRVVIDTSVHFTLMSQNGVDEPAQSSDDACLQSSPLVPLPTLRSRTRAYADCGNVSRTKTASCHRYASLHTSVFHPECARKPTPQQPRAIGRSGPAQAKSTNPRSSPQQKRCKQSFKQLALHSDSDCCPWESGDRSTSLAQLELVGKTAVNSDSSDPPIAGANSGSSSPRSPHPRQDRQCEPTRSPGQQTTESKQQQLKQIRAVMLVSCCQRQL